ncbi:hypothetical protein EVAR_48384_1 [Eumeta japonica]|uniref:Uncharacterized protein n=1 Tax=Eumeta variegata TaxID=151549 RepID=A0A4C1ZEL6_EUMVA|nr:hypothetical protein EVAR_48384_1 [Eumeta japonica]
MAQRVSKEGELGNSNRLSNFFLQFLSASFNMAMLQVVGREKKQSPSESSSDCGFLKRNENTNLTFGILYGPLPAPALRPRRARAPIYRQIRRNPRRRASD